MHGVYEIVMKIWPYKLSKAPDSNQPERSEPLMTHEFNQNHNYIIDMQGYLEFQNFLGHQATRPWPR